MGVCLSTEEQARSRLLEKQIHKDFKHERNVKKLLLLGTGESGKSTIVKQMKILHPHNECAKGLCEDTKKKQIKIIMNNILDSVQTILNAVDKLNVALSPSINKAELMEMMEKCSEEASTISPNLGQMIGALWKDPAVVTLMQNRAQFQILDSTDYFMENIERISSDDYMPTDADVLRARSMTTGIVTVSFKVDNLQFELVDVGGQRSERRKWLHVFDQVTAVMFIIALSEYDQMLYEDENVNRMQESLTLFTQMLANPFFRQTPFVLFLNKEDIFEKKIQHSPISAAFPEYTGPHTPEDSKSYIKKKFVEADKNAKRDVFTFYTTATNTDLVRNVFDSVKDIILNKIVQNF